jgi:hypothetical protein
MAPEEKERLLQKAQTEILSGISRGRISPPA